VLADKSYAAFIDEKVKQWEGNSVNSAEFKLRMSGKELLMSKEV
jgi:hypothetical protein